jgi:hypothetical protein
LNSKAIYILQEIMGVPAFFRWLSRKYTSVIVPCIEEKVCFIIRLLRMRLSSWTVKFKTFSGHKCVMSDVWAVPSLPCMPSWYAENRKGQNLTNLFNFVGLTSKPRMYVSHCNCNTFFRKQTYMHNNRLFAVLQYSFPTV